MSTVSRSKRFATTRRAHLQEAKASRQLFMAFGRGKARKYFLLLLVFGFLSVAASGNTRPFELLKDGPFVLMSGIACSAMFLKITSKARRS